MIFSAMLTDAFQWYPDGKFFNLRRLQGKSKVKTEVLDEFLFADDMANKTPTEENAQKTSV